MRVTDLGGGDIQGLFRVSELSCRGGHRPRKGEASMTNGCFF